MMVWESLVIVEGIVGNHSEIAVGLLGGRQGGCWRMVRACIRMIIGLFMMVRDCIGNMWEWDGGHRRFCLMVFCWKEGS